MAEDDEGWRHAGGGWFLHWTQLWSEHLHARNLLRALAADDARSLRQVAALLHALAERDIAPFELRCPGGW